MPVDSFQGRVHLDLLRSMARTEAAAHDGSSLPACSASMYSAYQSGQFSSRWPPMRVSCSPWAAAARRIALARSETEAKFVSFESIRPGNRVVTSCNSHWLPSGSLNVAYVKYLLRAGCGPLIGG